MDRLGSDKSLKLLGMPKNAAGTTLPWCLVLHIVDVASSSSLLRATALFSAVVGDSFILKHFFLLLFSSYGWGTQLGADDANHTKSISDDLLQSWTSLTPTGLVT